MSRTKRAVPYRFVDDLYYDYIWSPDFHLMRLKREPSKKEIAMQSADGVYSRSCYRYFYHLGNRVRRRADKSQIHRVYRLDDCDDFEFDPTFDKRGRGKIWWFY